MESADPSRLTLLSPRERECLALVGRGLRSKEIGPILGIDPATVDNTLKRAAKRVGVNDRRELARLFREHEPLMVQSIVQRLDQREKRLVNQDDPLADVVVASEEAPVPLLGQWPVPTAERQWNDLSAWQKRAWAAAIAFGVLAAASVLVAFSRHVLLRLAAGY